MEKPTRFALLFIALFISSALADEHNLVSQPTSYLPLEVSYAQVYRPADVYRSLEDVRAGRVQRQYGGPNTWVSVRGKADVAGRTYYRVSWDWGVGGWMAQSDLGFNQRLSRLRGVDLREHPSVDGSSRGPGGPDRAFNGSSRPDQDEMLAIVHVSALNVRSEPGELTNESRVGQLRAYDLVSVEEARRVGGSLWYRIGEEQWIHSGYVRTIRSRPRPIGVGKDERWIDVNLSEQIVIAMEGDTPVYAALAATGRPGFETVTGLYRIWIKITSAPMRGLNASYSYADMPWVMYFSGSYGLHGVYHHDSFGAARSAGCVNLSVYDANWFFHWAGPSLEPGERQRLASEDEPGTWVYVSY